MDSLEAAKAALTDALERADNPVAAARALRRVGARYDPEAATSWDAFRHAAEKELQPFLGDAAKPAAWAVLDAARAGGAWSPTREVGDGDPVAGGGRRTLAEILEDPEALSPPEPVVGHIAWGGRTTLLAAREKAGKSTLSTAGASATSKGRPFLAETTGAGDVLYLALEEHVSDVARRFTTFEADPERIHLRDRVADPFSDLEADVGEVQPALVVVDTLAALVEAVGPDPGSASDWTPIMTRLSRVARDSGAALLLLHHARKSDGRYRDSTAIGAGVDVVLEMQEGQESSVRKVRARARWNVRDYAVRLVQGGERPRYELTEGELSLDARVLMYLEQNPGASTRQVRENVEGKAMDVTVTLTRLETEGAVENRGQGSSHEWHPAENPGTGSGTAPGSPENPQGTATEPVSGTGAVPNGKPLEPVSGNRSEKALEEATRALDLRPDS